MHTHHNLHIIMYSYVERRFKKSFYANRTDSILRFYISTSRHLFGIKPTTRHTYLAHFVYKLMVRARAFRVCLQLRNSFHYGFVYANTTRAWTWTRNRWRRLRKEYRRLEKPLSRIYYIYIVHRYFICISLRHYAVGPL